MKIELTPQKYFREGRYFSRRFDCELTVSVDLDDKVSDDYVSHCADAVEGFSDEMIGEICEAAKRYCLAFIELYKEDADEDFSYEDEGLPYVTEKTPAREMLDHIQISGLLADEPEQAGQLCFRLTGGCDWEIEHGLEMSFQDGRLIYLGSYEQVTPSRADYYISGKGREWNYAVK